MGILGVVGSIPTWSLLWGVQQGNSTIQHCLLFLRSLPLGFFSPSQIGFCSAATTSQNSQTPLSSDLGCKYRSSSSLDGLGAASPGHGKNIGIFLLSQPILAPWGHLQCPWTAGIPCLSSLPPWNPDSLLCHPFPALLTPGSPPMVSFHSFFFYSWPHPAPSKPLCCTLQDHPLVFPFFGIPWFIHCYP